MFFFLHFFQIVIIGIQRLDAVFQKIIVADIGNQQGDK